MRHWVVPIVCAVALASCSKGAQVDVKNASVNDVAAAVTRSGVMTSGTMIEPGLWESKLTFKDVQMPDLPKNVAEQMKKSMARHREQTNSNCVTPDEVKNPKKGFFTGIDKSCRYQHFTMGSGKIDIRMICNVEGSTQTTDMAGTYTPTTYSMDMSSQSSGGHARGMAMKMHVDARRVGECSAKDG
jgi:hypothetical protein